MNILLSSITLVALSLLSVSAPLPAQSRKAPDLTLNTVVIDPGHGGKDAGTTSADKKTFEKTLTLKISRLFAARIREAYPEMKVLMTRDKDVFIPLNTRAKIASDADAKLFISIHINASARSKDINGFAAYILGPSNQGKYDSYEVNMDVCKRENSVIYLEDDYSTTYKDYDDSPESQIFLQLMQNAFREQSLAFAEAVSSHMENGPFKKNWGVMQGNFAVLRRASMPAVLLEFGFMTNPADLARLRSEERIAELVDNLFAAFVEYKSSYDKSVTLESAAGHGTPAPVSQPAVSDGTPVLYGTQILASAREMASSDKYFKGIETLAVKVGNLYKYIAMPSEDKAQAKEGYATVKKFFPDAFFVKVENGQVSRENGK
ncbi:MAG: N-acetylmuramoyl-L-alanine amidase [Bacteroidales bacterium]|nr:N-acetylmuramoyl-L-alanine amidase [Bacteroidales bacterium]